MRSPTDFPPFFLLLLLPLLLLLIGKMDGSTMDLILLTLPEGLKCRGANLVEISHKEEQERVNRKFRKSSRPVTDEELQEKKKAKKTAEPLAIAKLIMELWSPSMRCHAENLILNIAMQVDYLKQSHIKWVNVLDKNKVENDFDVDWVIEDQDEAIIELVWNRFNMKQHFYQTWFHRLWIQRSYDRLKETVNLLSPEVIDRHDLSKFAFSQAVGYTLKWVHSIFHGIWTAACDLHLHNEPHHPKTWSNLYTPEQKKMKLECWLSDACDFRNGVPYGLDLTTLDLKSEELADIFLQESYIDMVAVEWERKKGKLLSITTRELAYMDDKFLQRYTPRQHQIVHDLILSVIASDQTLNEVVLTEREKKLLLTIPKKEHPIIICQIENQKKSEVTRQLKLANSERSINNLPPHPNPTEEMIQKGHDFAFFITVCCVVTETWSDRVRQYAENVILKKAVEENLLKESHVQWVGVFNPLVEGLSEEENMIDDELLIQLLWEDFNLREHFIQVNVHRYWVKQSYFRLLEFMREIPEEVIERHDLTKFALSQSLGYTLKWIHDINYPVWRKACTKHLNCEPHHPEMWSSKHKPEEKQSCLENWLHWKSGGSTYNVDIEGVEFISGNVPKMFLKESLLDMVAVEWERNKGKRPDLTYTELVYMEDRFLARYSVNDKEFILELMSSIRQADRNL